MLSIIAIALLAATGQVDIPKDSDFYRFVPPGQEQAVVPALYKYKTPALSEINEIDLPFGGTGLNFSSNIADPSDASKMRVLMFYGIDKAKEMALRKLIVQSKKKTSPTDVNFTCAPYQPSGLRSAFSSKSKKKAQSGDWWYSCMAATADL